MTEDEMTEDDTTATHGTPSAVSRLRSTTIASPVGTLTVVAGDRGVRAVLWPDERPDRVPLDDAVEAFDSGPWSGAARGDHGRTGSDTTPDAESVDGGVWSRGHVGIEAILAMTVSQLEEYFRGERTDFDLPLDPDGTDFQREAWTALRTIPFGSTITYGEQAERMGDKRKARAVGAANGRNPISIVVPCHRVVGSTGALTGFAGGIETKRWLLEHESRVAGNTLL